MESWGWQLQGVLRRDASAGEVQGNPGAAGCWSMTHWTGAGRYTTAAPPQLRFLHTPGHTPALGRRLVYKTPEGEKEVLTRSVALTVPAYIAADLVRGSLRGCLSCSFARSTCSGCLFCQPHPRLPRMCRPPKAGTCALHCTWLSTALLATQECTGTRGRARRPATQLLARTLPLPPTPHPRPPLTHPPSPPTHLPHKHQPPTPTGAPRGPRRRQRP